MMNGNVKGKMNNKVKNTVKNSIGNVIDRPSFSAVGKLVEILWASHWSLSLMNICLQHQQYSCMENKINNW